MFAKIFALFALMAVAFAAPNPKPNPKPEPQVLAYSTGLDYVYPAAVPSVVSPYVAAAPVAYDYTPYSAYPSGAIYLRR